MVLKRGVGRHPDHLKFMQPQKALVKVNVNIRCIRHLIKQQMIQQSKENLL